MEPDSDQAVARQRRASVFRRGQKSELFADAQGLDEKDELENKLDDLHAVWALERTGHDFAAAIWRPALALAEVVLQKGKLLTHMGVSRGNKLFLCIEEAVYLLDRANLLLFVEEGGNNGRARQRPSQQRLLSLAEAHELMAGAGVPLDRYLVFCKLLRAGYIVQRHPARWQLRPGEDPARVWDGWGGLPQGTGGEQGQQGQRQGGQRQPARALSQTAAAAAAVPPGVPRAKRVKVDPAATATRWWVAAAPPTRQAERSAGAPGELPNGGDGVPSSNPWMAGMPAGFLDALPRCEVLQGRTHSVRDDFPLMAPLQAVPLAELQPAAASDGRHLLHYDVFASNSRFSRKAPGAPLCVVSVLPCTRLASPADMAAADAAAGVTPVRFSTVERGDVCFYGLSHVELRGLLPGG